jgi:hypothetical protein
MVVSDFKLFEKPAKRPKKTAMSTNLPPEFDMGSPFDFAWAEGSAARDGADVAGVGDQHDVEVRSDGEEDDCLFRDDPPEDFAEVIAEGLEEEHLLPDFGHDEADHGESEPEEAEEEEEHDEATEAAERIERAIAESEITERGYINCPVDPWSSKQPDIARITHWPDGVPEWQQSMACRCYMHPGCSLSRKRGAYTTQQILRWVYSMQPLPADATGEQRRAARDQHLGVKAAELVPKKAAAKPDGPAP